MIDGRINSDIKYVNRLIIKYSQYYLNYSGSAGGSGKGDGASGWSKT